MNSRARELSKQHKDHATHEELLQKNGEQTHRVGNQQQRSNTLEQEKNPTNMERDKCKITEAPSTGKAKDLQLTQIIQQAEDGAIYIVELAEDSQPSHEEGFATIEELNEPRNRELQLVQNDNPSLSLKRNREVIDIFDHNNALVSLDNYFSVEVIIAESSKLELSRLSGGLDTGLRKQEVFYGRNYHKAQ
ncbi:hypothetical protein PIB30_018452 [Stylosanthes scabra]|uniref:Uncharacterized protein n=1 Tax=Stylosanthes scabra TaxID=79078 RepID=A0ABU6U9P5_9FABA|nr:hypothetical protein [Stylosanthes scabra]